MSVRSYEFEVKMHCGGCSGAVGRVLGKLEGVKSFTTNLETQKVNVTADPELGLDKVLATIAKTGKQVVSSKELDGSKEAVDSKEAVGSKETVVSKEAVGSKETVGSKEVVDSKEAVGSKEL